MHTYLRQRSWTDLLHPISVSEISCVQCAPDYFTRLTPEYSPRQLVELAAESRKSLGREITGVDFSALDDQAAEGSANPSSVETGLDTALTQVSTDGRITSTGPGASVNPASSTEAASTPQGTGAATVAVQAHHVLAPIIAIGIGAAYYV